jgi:putative PEP-CTERM system histidine kinase
MHDLKNIIAQQELVVANAQKFGDRPEFVRDAVATVRSGVGRMKKVLAQLRESTAPRASTAKAELSKVLMEVRSRCADRQPVPDVKLPDGSVWLGIDRDRLASVFEHLVRNAQDATPADGCIEVEANCEDSVVRVRVSDTGSGMDRQFVRDRLFRPFDTTKGAQGMGIGAYQVRETVRAAGGKLEVTSNPGRGTTFLVSLPVLREGQV